MKDEGQRWIKRCEMRSWSMPTKADSTDRIGTSALCQQSTVRVPVRLNPLKRRSGVTDDISTSCLFKTTKKRSNSALSAFHDDSCLIGLHHYHCRPSNGSSGSLRLPPFGSLVYQVLELNTCQSHMLTVSLDGLPNKMILENCRKQAVIVLSLW
jgi:hypothetical protein